jgi:hypothetical protein
MIIANRSWQGLKLKLLASEIRVPDQNEMLTGKTQTERIEIVI